MAVSPIKNEDIDTRDLVLWAQQAAAGAFLPLLHFAGHYYLMRFWHSSEKVFRQEGRETTVALPERLLVLMNPSHLTDFNLDISIKSDRISGTSKYGMDVLSYTSVKRLNALRKAGENA